MSGAINYPEVGRKERLERDYKKKTILAEKKKEKVSGVFLNGLEECSAISCLYPQMFSEALRKHFAKANGPLCLKFIIYV